MLDSIRASGAEIVTVAIRRISLQGGAGDDRRLAVASFTSCRIRPAGTARDAVLTAKLAREALETNWLKLEVIGDRETLYPDAEHPAGGGRTRRGRGLSLCRTVRTIRYFCRKLEDIGCSAIMPLGSADWLRHGHRESP